MLFYLCGSSDIPAHTAFRLHRYALPKAAARQKTRISSHRTLLTHCAASRNGRPLLKHCIAAYDAVGYFRSVGPDALPKHACPDMGIGYAAIPAYYGIAVYNAPTPYLRAVRYINGGRDYHIAAYIRLFAYSGAKKAAFAVKSIKMRLSVFLSVAYITPVAGIGNAGNAASLLQQCGENILRKISTGVFLNNIQHRRLQNIYSGIAVRGIHPAPRRLFLKGSDIAVFVQTDHPEIRGR